MTHRPRQLNRRQARASSLRARLEALESRTLFSMTTFQSGVNLAPDISTDNAVTTDNAGHLFMSDDDGNIDFISKNADGSLNITAHSTNGLLPGDLVYDSANGHIYFSDYQGADIGEMDSSGNMIRTYTLNSDGSELPVSLAVASDGAVWFSSAATPSTGDITSTSYVGRIGTDGTLTQAVIPFSEQAASYLAAGANGSMWMVDNGGVHNGVGGDSKISNVTLGSDGTFSYSTFDVPTSQALITGFTSSSDGSLWLAIGRDVAGSTARPDMPDQIQHITFSGGTPTFTTYDVPIVSGESALDPYSLTLDSTGKLWFSELFSAKLSYFDTTNDTWSRETIPNAQMGSSSRMAVINGSSGPADVWLITMDGVLVDDNLSTPPAIATAGNANLSGTANTAISGNLLSFSSSVDSDFAYTINYGNGTTGSGTLANSASGNYTIPASVTYAAAGNYVVTVAIADSNGDLKTVTGTATITSGSTAPAATAIALAGPEQKPLANNISGVSSLVVASFTGPAATYTATITWGDGTSSVGRIVSNSSGGYYVAMQSGATKTYATQGTYTVTVAISNGSTITTVSSTATISDTPLVASQNLTLQPLIGKIVLNVVATFTDDPNATASEFTATINWGDNKTSVGLIVRNPLVAGQFYVIGLHSYAKSGTYHISTLILNPSESESATATATVKV